jgi:hypothetical protein
MEMLLFICYNHGKEVASMVDNRLRIKRNVFFIVALATFSLSLLFTLGTVFALTVVLAFDETSVGTIYLGNRVELDYPGYLDRRVSEWRDNAAYEVSFQGYALLIDLELLTFDTEATVEQLVRNTDNRAIFTLSLVNREAIRFDIENLFSSDVTVHFDADRFFDQLLNDVSGLVAFRNYRLLDFLSSSSGQTTLGMHVIDGLEVEDVDQIVSASGFLEVRAFYRFSLLEELNSSNLDNNQLSILASGLLEVIGNTRFRSLLYRSLPVMPEWAEIGRNVRIMKINELDFSFYNPMEFDYRFVLTKASPTALQIELIGYPFVETIESIWEQMAVVLFSTEIIDDATINATTPGVVVIDLPDATIYRVVVRAGVNGEIWFLNRTILMPIAGDVVDERIAIDERPTVTAIYKENNVPKGGG